MAEIDVTRIAGNIGAMNALNSLSGINKQLSVHQTRLATGKRINSAADDPAGLTIATKMFSRSEGLKVALNNIGDAKNLLAVAESGLGRINDILVQMRNKAEAAASDTMGADERTAIKTQLSAFAEQIDDIVKQTSWNSKKLLDGTGNPLRFQTGAESSDSTTMEKIANVGANSLGIARIETADSSSVGTASGGAVANVAVNTANLKTAGFTDGTYTMKYTVSNFAENTIAVNGDDGYNLNVKFYDEGGSEVNSLATTKAITETGAVTAVNLGNGVTFNISDAIDANSATEVTGGVFTLVTEGYHVDAYTASEFASYMDDVQDGMNIVNAEMSKVGALTGRMTFKEDQISASQINTEAAYNRIMNANMAEEQVNASKFQILQQTATAMLAQANAAPQFLLSLFR
jgi:flagellin